MENDMKVVRIDSVLARVVLAMPMWVPLYAVHVRVGDNTTDFVRIGVCRTFTR